MGHEVRMRSAHILFYAGFAGEVDYKRCPPQAYRLKLLAPCSRLPAAALM